MKKFLVLLVLVFLVLGVSGCAQSSSGTSLPKPTTAVSKYPPISSKTVASTRPTPISFPSTESPPSVSDNTVIIKKGGFDPQVITVKTGATVRWQNTDDSVHRMNFVDGYQTQILSPGQSCSKIFGNPGVFDYTDMINPNLRGTVRVE
jgi:plastocyanin